MTRPRQKGLLPSWEPGPAHPGLCECRGQGSQAEQDQDDPQHRANRKRESQHRYGGSKTSEPTQNKTRQGQRDGRRGGGAERQREGAADLGEGARDGSLVEQQAAWRNSSIALDQCSDQNQRTTQGQEHSERDQAVKLPDRG